MKDICKYLDETVATSMYPITISSHKPNAIRKWIILRRPIDNEPHLGLKPLLDLTARIIPGHESSLYTEEELERNWRHYTSVEACLLPGKAFSSLNGSKLVYCLCGIYSEWEQKVQFFVSSLNPIRMWINGEVVHISSENYGVENHHFLYCLKEGINTVLVERNCSIKVQERGLPDQPFFITLKPEGYYEQKKFGSFRNVELNEYMKNSYGILPTRTFYEENEDIHFTVLTKDFKYGENERIRVGIYDSKGILLDSVETATSREIVFKTGLGVLRIVAESVCRYGKSSCIYVFRGDFEKYKGCLLDDGQRIMGDEDWGKEILEVAQRYLEIPEVFLADRCFITERLSNPVLEKAARLEAFMEAYDGNKKSIFDVFGWNVMLFQKSDIDDGFITFNVYLPPDYSLDKKYPMAVYFDFGFGLSKYPETKVFMQQQIFEDVILLAICGRGGLNRDYINEMGILKGIDEISNKLPVDRDRIYGIGTCSGSMKLFGLAARAPHLFTALTAINGTVRMDLYNADFGTVENIGQTPVNQLCLAEDYTFNLSRVHNALKYFGRLEYIMFHDMEHQEFGEYLNNRSLLKNAIIAKKCKYPKEIKFHISEPVYNRSYWIKVDSIADLQRKGYIHAQIKSPGQIEIISENINSFSLLLDRCEMGLGNTLDIQVNHFSERVGIGDYAKILVCQTDEGLRIEAAIMQRDGFLHEYGRIAADESKLGIKGLYYDRCIIVKPDYYKGLKRGTARRLLAILKNPLKERCRNYRYDTLLESSLDKDTLKRCNFVLPADIRQQNDSLLWGKWSMDIKLDGSSLYIGQREFTGEYLALIKKQNPFNSGRHGLLAVYNSDNAESQLADFLESFDTNPLFYSDCVVYNNQEYYSF